VATGNIFNDLSPHARVITAVLPFAFAVFMRLLVGNNRLTRWLISLTILWFAANILMAPYSARMRQDIRNLRTLLP
jgi:hypothetical protein